MRLTTNKPVIEMTMLELACNCVYSKDKYIYYRDYETDEPLIDFAMNLSEKLGGNITTARTDDIESVEEELWDDLNYPLTDVNGLVAFTYRNLVAIGELRERLKEYENLEEQGKLIKLPCAVGDIVYVKMQFGGIAKAEVREYTYFNSCGFCIVVTSKSFDKQNIPFSEFGKTVFLSEPEAEQELKERRNKQ